MNIKGIFFFGVKNGVKGWRENDVKYGVYTILVLWVGDGLKQ